MNFPIKKAVIFYFSGTGNAKQVTSWLAEFAGKKGVACQTFDISKVDPGSLEAISRDTLIIIISPVHGFNFPKITLNFIERFPKGKNNIVLMNTRAGMKIGHFITPGLTGIAFILSSFLLMRKGYKITGQIPFDMPSNWISIHPSLNKQTIKFIHQKIYFRTEKHAVKIFSGKRDFLAFRDILQDLLISPVSMGYYLIGRFAFAKSFYASKDCDNCGICLNSCPVSAIIRVNNRPFWTFKCESCMKCMNFCPRKAIDTSHGLLATAYVLGSTLTSYILSHLFTITIQPGFSRLLLSSLIFLGLLWGLYKFQHVLLGNEIIRKLITFTSLTHYKFWGRYRSIPERQWKN